MFQIIVLFGVCLTGWFLLDRIVIEPAHMIRQAANGRSRKGQRRREYEAVRISRQRYDSTSIEPAPNQKALYDAFGERFFKYE